MAGAASVGLTAREARWLAVEAQGLSRPRRRTKAGPSDSQIVAAAAALGAVQLDAVNVLERTQFLVLFSRLGPFDRSALHRLTGPGGALWEYWGHAASLMPATDEPLFRWRYEIGGTYVPGPKVRARVQAAEAANAGYLAAVLDEVRERGPLTARELSDPRPRSGQWWERRSGGRRALAWLYGRGRLASWRSPAFESVYDVPERALHPHVLATPTPVAADAQRALLAKAARACGVGTVGDIAGYYMIRPSVAKPLIADLVEAGELLAVSVEGWNEPAYTPAEATPRRPARTTGTLLSPFDSLVWDRARTQRLFGFDYRIEIYVPAPKRVHGYYVLPFLLGDRLVARFDLKADRRRGTLHVAAAHAEPGTKSELVAAAAAAELENMRSWLGLDDVTVTDRGDLASAVSAAVSRGG